MYKQSIYNRVLSLNDNVWYIHNILSSAECVLFEKEKKFFDNINENVTEEYLVSLRKQWINMGFFVNSDFDEIASLLLERKIHIYSHMKDYSGFVIAPTMDCNARCFYCYEDDTRANVYMSENTACEIVQYIKENAVGKKKIFVSWFGGEPLMCMNHMVSMSQELIDFCQNNNIEYDSEITTNGYFLKENIDKIKECSVTEVQVTLDGTEEEHLRRKRFINGKSAWEKIINGIFEASLKGIHVTVRINFDQRNFEDVL